MGSIFPAGRELVQDASREKPWASEHSGARKLPASNSVKRYELKRKNEEMELEEVPVGVVERSTVNPKLMVQQIVFKAYGAVLRAFSSQSATISWSRQQVLCDLRLALEVSNDDHLKLLGILEEQRNSKFPNHGVRSAPAGEFELSPAEQKKVIQNPGIVGSPKPAAAVINVNQATTVKGSRVSGKMRVKGLKQKSQKRAHLSTRR